MSAPEMEYAPEEMRPEGTEYQEENPQACLIRKPGFFNNVEGFANIFCWWFGHSDN